MVPYEMLNDEQKNVIQEIIKGDIHENSVFLSGLAGTGKTETILHLQEQLKTHEIPFIVMATTGTAAAQAGGVTIHFGLGLTPSMISRGQFKGEPIDDFNRARYIFIDESSMLDKIVYKALRANMTKEQKLIFTGDLNQLPVVNKGSGRRSFEALLKTMLFYIVGEPMKVFLLKKVVRQDGDLAFAEGLNKLALEGYYSGLNDLFDQTWLIDKNDEESDMRRIADRLVRLAIEQKDCPFIAATHAECDRINSICTEILADMEGISSRTYSVVELNRMPMGKFSTENRRIIRSILEDIHEETEQRFYLKEKVMITANKVNPDTQKIEYANGNIGFITGLAEDHIEIIMWDKSTKSYVPRIVEYHEEWDTIEFTDADGDEEIFAYRRVKRVPLVPGYAITSHRSQGMTVEEAYIDPQGAFEYSQVYTMISRVKTSGGVHLVRPIRERDVKVNPYASEFYKFVLEHERGYNQWELNIFMNPTAVTTDCYLSLKDRLYLKYKEDAIDKYREYEEISRGLRRNDLDYYVWEVFYDYMFSENIGDIIDQMFKFNRITPKKDPRLPSAIIEGIRQRDDHIISSWLAGEYDDILDKRRYGYPLLGLEEEFLKQAIKEFKGLEIEME